jgi:hypothetical protein
MIQSQNNVTYYIPDGLIFVGSNHGSQQIFALFMLPFSIKLFWDISPRGEVLSLELWRSVPEIAVYSSFIGTIATLHPSPEYEVTWNYVCSESHTCVTAKENALLEK